MEQPCLVGVAAACTTSTWPSYHLGCATLRMQFALISTHCKLLKAGYTHHSLCLPVAGPALPSDAFTAPLCACLPCSPPACWTSVAVVGVSMCIAVCLLHKWERMQQQPAGV